MSVSDYVLVALGALGGNAFLVTALGFLAKALVGNSLAKDPSRFQAEMKAASDRSIEEFKSQLGLAAVEHEVRFSALHEKRAEVIAEVYKRLAETNREAHLSTVRPEAYESAMQMLVDFALYVDTHRLYLLDDDLYAKLSKFADELDRLVSKYSINLTNRFVPGGGGVPSPSEMERRKEVFDEVWRGFSEEIPELRKALERQMRAILDPRAGARE